MTGDKTYLLIQLVRVQPVLELPMQRRHFLHRTLLGRHLGHLGLKATSFGASFERAGVEQEDIILANVDVVGLEGGALRRGPSATGAPIDTDETSRVAREADATERTGRRKTGRCLFDDVVAAVQA